MILKRFKKLFFILFPKNFVGTSNSKTRNQWLEEKLKTIPPGSKILDAGAGDGNKKKFCEHLDYISQDIAEYDGIQEDEGLQTGKVDYTNLDIVSDISNIPLQDKSLDAILCVEVIEHIPNPLEAFMEFSRLLKQDGIVILTAPFNSLTHYAPYHYSTGFSKYYYEKHLPEFNFEIVEITPNGNFFEYLAQEVRRTNEVAKTYNQNKFIGFYFIIGKLLILRSLKKLSKNDNNSSELLCFGFNVIARKL